MTLPTQSINYHTAPAALSITGVAAANTFQWQSSSVDKETAWQDIPGANAATYSPGVLDATTCYRVKVSMSVTNFYWARAVVNVLPPLQAGLLSPASQTVAYDSVPAVLAVGGLRGGDGNYTYQWYSSTDSLNWTPLTVFTPQYIPGGMEQTTWYRVLVTSNGQTATGNLAAVRVKAPPAAVKNN